MSHKSGDLCLRSNVIRDTSDRPQESPIAPSLYSPFKRSHKCQIQAFSLKLASLQLRIPHSSTTYPRWQQSKLSQLQTILAPSTLEQFRAVEKYSKIDSHSGTSNRTARIQSSSICNRPPTLLSRQEGPSTWSNDRLWASRPWPEHLYLPHITSPGTANVCKPASKPQARAALGSV